MVYDLNVGTDNAVLIHDELQIAQGIDVTGERLVADTAVEAGYDATTLVNSSHRRLRAADSKDQVEAS